MLELMLRVREEALIEVGELWPGIDEDEEREMESGAESGNEGDRIGLDLEEP